MEGNSRLSAIVEIKYGDIGKRKISQYSYDLLIFGVLRSDFQHVKGRFPSLKVHDFQNMAWVSTIRFNSDTIYSEMLLEKVG